MSIHRGAVVLQNVGTATLAAPGSVTSTATTLAAVTASTPSAVTAAQGVAGAAGLNNTVIATTITVGGGAQTYFTFTSAGSPPIIIVADANGVIEYST